MDTTFEAPKSDILRISVLAGSILLENGSETSRTEEIMTLICKQYGMQDAGSYVTPTGIMLSVTDNLGKTTSIIHRIKSRKINFEKITQVNALCNSLEEKSISFNDCESALHTINNTKQHSKIVRIISSGIVASFFCLFFDGNIRDFIISFFVGIILLLMSDALGKLNMTDFLVNTLGGMITTALAYSIAFFIPHLNPNAIIIGSIMLLLPGLTIINAVKDTIAGDLVSGVARLVEALIVAVAIALGSVVSLKILYALSILKIQGVY